jgi:hypothetical protein
MKLTIHATRTGKTLKGTLDDAPDVVQGSNIYSYELEVEGEGRLTPVADCQHKQAFGTHIRPGDAMPSRACPARPRPEPVDKGKKDIMPSDMYEVVAMSECPTCEWGGDSVIGVEQDRVRIIKAFQEQLKTEDFSGFPELTDEDRNWKRWQILWNRVEMEGK